MHCLHIVQRFSPAVGGSEAVMQRISRDLATRGHSVRVVTTTARSVDALWRPMPDDFEEGVEDHEGVAVTRLRPRYLPVHGLTMQVLSHLPLGDGWRARFQMPGPYVPQLPEVLRDGPRPDVIHASALPFTPLIAGALDYGRDAGSLVVISPFLHLSMPPRAGFGYQRPLQKRLLARADLLLAQTTVEAEKLRAVVAAQKGTARVEIMGVGIEPETVAGGDAARFRTRWSLPDTARPVIGFLGAVTHDKGAQDLVRAFVRMNAHAHLLLAGPERDDFREFYRRLPPRETERIVVTGPLTDAERRDFFAGIDIFAMPSRSESFGIVYCEAWTYGVPVIGCDIPAVREVITDGDNGLRVPFGDVPAIADALDTLCASDETRAALGTRGRQTVHDAFLWPDKFSRYCEILESMGMEL